MDIQHYNLQVCFADNDSYSVHIWSSMMASEYPADRVQIFASLSAYPAGGAYLAGREWFLHSLTASPAGRVQIFASLASIWLY